MERQMAAKLWLAEIANKPKGRTGSIRERHDAGSVEAITAEEQSEVVATMLIQRVPQRGMT
jgi:hypothetical protein